MSKAAVQPIDVARAMILLQCEYKSLRISTEAFDKLNHICATIIPSAIPPQTEWSEPHVSTSQAGPSEGRRNRTNRHRA